MNPVTPRKSLGQHFLVDPNTARKIVSALRADTDDQVIEIGPGVGALTGLLAERYSNFAAVEIDQRAADHLRSEMPTTRVHVMDALEFDWAKLASEGRRRVFVIGNLPYNISSPLLFRFFAAAPFLADAVVMIQLEVAQRLVAAPRTKAYGILSVAAQLSCNPELLFNVSNTVFRPRPAVVSAVVRLAFDTDEPTRYTGPVRDVVRTAFNQRRKTLRNSLKRITAESGRSVPDKWASKRAEELAPEEFVELTHYLGR